MLRKFIHNSTASRRKVEKRTGFASHAGLAIDLNTNMDQERGLTPEESAEIRQRQVEQAANGVPLHLFFIFCSVVTIAIVANPNMSEAMRWGWALAGLLPIFVYGFGWFAVQRQGMHELGAKLFEGAALLQGLVWTVPLSLFLGDAPPPTQTIIIGVSLAVAGVGALALTRMPIGAIVLSCLTVGAASRAVYIHVDNSSLAPSMLCVTYGFVLVGIVVSMHWEFLKATRAELEVVRQRQVIALLLNDFEQGTSDWLWETDRDGNISYFSPRFAEALGRDDEDILGQPFAGIVEPDQDAGGWAAFTSSIARKEDIPSLLLSLKLKGQNKHWQMTARPLFADDGSFLGYRGVGRDVSERWQSEQAIRYAKESAERANTAKSQFLDIVGHEIRTPLNAIVGFAELLMSDSVDVAASKSRREYLQTILNSAHQLQALINDVLDTTRIEKGTLKLLEQQLDAAEIAEVAAKMCRDQANQAGVTVIVNVVDNISIFGDQSRLKQVMYNLLSNAIKFSSDGGTVNASFERGHGHEFIFAVRDSGAGIRAEDAERVFEPFVQADEGSTRRYGGLGLGLSLARKIARLHGGDITLTSRHGAGTVARLTLPPSRITWPGNLRASSGEIAA